MKTTERHELKHNEVADTLHEAYARIDQNRKAILVGAVVVVVALARVGRLSLLRHPAAEQGGRPAGAGARGGRGAGGASGCAGGRPARAADAGRQLSDRAGEARGSPAEAARRRRRVSDDPGWRVGAVPSRRSARCAGEDLRGTAAVREGGLGWRPRPLRPHGTTRPGRARREGRPVRPGHRNAARVVARRQGRPAGGRRAGAPRRRVHRCRQEDRGPAGAAARDLGVRDVALRGGSEEAARRPQGRRLGPTHVSHRDTEVTKTHRD